MNYKKRLFIRSILTSIFSFPLFVGTSTAGPPRPGGDTALAYVVDVSGSTRDYESCENYMLSPPAPQGPILLQCEIGAIVNLNRQAEDTLSIGHVGLVVFADRAVPAIVDGSLSLLPTWTAPDAKSDPTQLFVDLEIAARSIRHYDYYVSGEGEIYRFSRRIVGAGTNFEEAIRAACTAASNSPLPNKMIVFISDGERNLGLPVAQLELQSLCPRIPFHVFAVGNASCSSDLSDLACLSGGTCTEVPTPTDLPDILAPKTSSLTVTRLHLGSFAGLSSTAWDINEHEEVVGVSSIWLDGNGNAIGRGFLWRDDGAGLRDLGTLAQLGHNGSNALRINDAGQVAGDSFLGGSEPLQRRGFRITPLDLDSDGTRDTWFQDTNNDGVNDLMVPVPTLGGPSNRVTDMNSQGYIVGESALPGSFDGVHAFLWRPGTTGAIDVGTPGGATSSAIAINDAGIVLGSGLDVGGVQRLFRVTPLDSDGDGIDDTWFKDDTPADGINDLMEVVDLELPAGTISVTPWAMNNAGDIVGVATFSFFPDPLSIAGVWAPDGTFTEIAPSFSYALDINDRRQVIGYWAGGGVSNPYRWTETTGKVAIGELSNSTGVPFAINRLGDRLVGSSNNAGELQATLWRITNSALGFNRCLKETAGIFITLNNVTQEGYTDVVQTDQNPGPIIPGSQFNGVFYNVTTTAGFTGTVDICLPSPPSPSPTLRHLVNGQWEDVTTRYDSGRAAVCGAVNSLSWFAVAADLHAPVANAGPNRIVACDSRVGAEVTLDGAASFDPDGDVLNYTWTGAFGSAGGVTPTVTMPLGENAVDLVVSDGATSSHSSESLVQVVAQVQGLAPPLGALVPEESGVAPPEKAFKSGRTLPLRLQLFCGDTLLTDADVSGPVLEAVQRIDDALDLELVDLDAGQANSASDAFRFADGEWAYNLSTKGLPGGTYRILVGMPDGLRYETIVVLR